MVLLVDGDLPFVDRHGAEVKRVDGERLHIGQIQSPSHEHFVPVDGEVVVAEGRRVFRTEDDRDSGPKEGQTRMVVDVGRVVEHLVADDAYLHSDSFLSDDIEQIRMLEESDPVSDALSVQQQRLESVLRVPTGSWTLTEGIRSTK